MRNNAPAGRVLVFGDDSRMFLSVVRSLGRAGLDVHAAPFFTGTAPAQSRYIARIHHLPAYDNEPEAWLAAVNALIDQFGFDLLVPCCDRSLLPLDAVRDRLRPARIAMPDRKVVDTLFDKERTRQLCMDLGIPVSPGAPLSPRDTAAGLVARYGLPLVIKPRRSYAFGRLGTRNKVVCLPDAAAVENHLARIGDPRGHLAERFFPGTGVGVSVLANRGRIEHAFQHRRLTEPRFSPGSSLRVSERVRPELLAACDKIAAHLQLTGVCMFEFRENAAGDWVLIETNARFWGSLPLAVAAGVDFPVLLYDLLVHGRTHPARPYLTGLRSRNLLIDMHDIAASVRVRTLADAGHLVRRLGDFALQPLRWLILRERADTFAADDLRPMIYEFLYALGGAARRAGLARPRHA